MPIRYPEGPIPEEGWDRPGRLQLKPGEGIGITQVTSLEKFDFTVPTGRGSAGIVSLIAQLSTWGYECVKVEEWVEVSPVYTPYYERTMEQKAALERRIRENLAEVSKALAGLRATEEELRIYKEYMDYYSQMERGKKLIKMRRVEEGKKLLRKGDTTLKHVWIDRVDVHTGPEIALKRIVVKWPTIISDFLKLEDVDIEPERIAKKLKISIAEATVLATKNKLYLEWRDKIFRPKVEEDYKRLRTQVEGWRRSWEEYRRWLMPLILRYKSFRVHEEPHKLQRIAIWRPGAIAVSLDKTVLWAWRPFAPTEKFRVVREYIETVAAREAGFTAEEIAEIRKVYPDWDGRVRKLPFEPSVDRVVRRYLKDVEREYKVKLTPIDLYEARRRFASVFWQMRRRRMPWVESPYFVFFEIPLIRLTIRLPDGTEVEDIVIAEPSMTARLDTQNLILLRYLELRARDKKVEEEMKKMLGEVGVEKEVIKTLEELLSAEYPEIFPPKVIRVGLLDRIRNKLEYVVSKTADRARATLEFVRTVKSLIGEFLRSIGIVIPFFRVIGPYEFDYGRIYPLYCERVLESYLTLMEWLKTRFEVV